MKPYLVYYKKLDFPYDGDEDYDLHPYLHRDYVPVSVVVAEDEECVFQYMQGEVWSPNGEAKELIEALGLRHTSMSICDIVYDINEGTYYKVVTLGFLRVLPSF